MEEVVVVGWAVLVSGWMLGWVGLFGMNWVEWRVFKYACLPEV